MIIMKIIEFHSRIMKINKKYRNPQENHETNENQKIQTRMTKIMKVVEFHMRITKFMKILESHNRINKIMEILEFHRRSMKIMKII